MAGPRPSSPVPTRRKPRPHAIAFRLIVWHLHRFIGGTLTARLPWGTYKVHPKDGLGSKGMYVWQTYSPHEVEILKAALQPGDTFWDVGAHAGALTGIASHLVGPKGRVVAFEPYPRNADVLRRNTKHLTNVVVMETGLSNVHGIVPIHRGKHLSGLSLQSNGPDAGMVSVTRGDHVNAPRPNVAKIDTEGHEIEVLEGMGSVLPFVRSLLVECHGDGKLNEVRKFFAARGWVVAQVGPIDRGSKWVVSTRLTRSEAADQLRGMSGVPHD